MYVTRWNIGFRSQTEAESLLRFTERTGLTDLLIHSDRGDAGTKRRNFDYLTFISERFAGRTWLWWSGQHVEGQKEQLERHPKLHGLHLEKGEVQMEVLDKPVTYNVCRTSKLLPDKEPVPLLFSNAKKGFIERLEWARDLGAKTVVFPAWQHFLFGAKERLQALGNLAPYFYFYHADPRLEVLIDSV